MDFLLSDEQEKNKKAYAAFAREFVKPYARKIDESEEFPRETVQKLMKKGYLGIPIPEEYGGQGQDYLSYILCVEELSKYCAATALILSAHTSLCAGTLQKYGTKEQKKTYLTELADGRKLGAFALTEPGAGTDAGSIVTKAVRQGDFYILNGTKVFITNGKEADLYLIVASTNPERGSNGMSIFIVEKGTEGFTFGQREKQMGVRASATYELIFKDCKIPARNLLGKEEYGYQMAMDGLDGGRIGIAAQALGIAEGALETTISFAQSRKQFGKNIASFQNTQFRLAEMSAKIEAARYLVYRAALAKEQGEAYSVHAARAKLLASRTAVEVTEEAVQLHGGYGCSREYEVERMMRDAKVTEIYEGTSEVQRMVIAGALLKSKSGKKEKQEEHHLVLLDENTNQIITEVKRIIEEVSSDGGEIIIGLGRGIATHAGLAQATELGNRIKASFGTTRPLVTLGFADESCMVGQTGRAIEPDLYLALGISGMMQHMSGVNAKQMIAVNIDAGAPILKEADYAIVGEAEKFVGKLLER